MILTGRPVVLLITIVFFVDGFNFDAKYPVIATGTPDSYFGYSLAVHEISTSKVLLVGAPKDLIGSLFQCQSRGNKFNCNPTSGFESKIPGGYEWLGATVISRVGTAMVCAPRAGEYVTGECFYSNGSLSSFTSYVPTTEQYCEVGFSASLSADGNRFYVGGPTCSKNGGELFTSTKPNPNINKNAYHGDVSYLAYAMAPGNVLKQTEGLVVSVGFHHDSDFAGKVLIYDHLKNESSGSLVGFQSGEHFGASLAVIDLNKDGRDEIIVGAPHHTDYGNSEIKFDIGAVYIYYQNSDGRYERRATSTKEPDLKGKTTGAQFGYALAGLGDSDGDGFYELAVGAPYEDEGHGTVYIYQGKMLNPQSFKSQPSQIITGKSFSPPIRTFGFSFNNVASDFDNNKYTDLIVGAYQADKVVLLPARPVVRLTSQITFNPESISLDKKECKNPNNPSVQVPCATMRYCMTYDGVNVPTNMNVKINITLDAAQPKFHRLLFIKTNQYNLLETVPLILKNQKCQEKTVYVQSVGSISSSMDVTLFATIPETSAPLSPVLDISDSGNGYAFKTLTARRECGSDSTCTPDLQLNINMNSDTFVQGSNENLVMDVAIYNAGEEAYGVKFYLNLPSAFKYNTTDREHTDPSVSCSSSDDNPYLICDIGNSLLSKKTAKLRISIQLIPTNEKFIDFTAETNSTDKEVSTLDDNRKTLRLTFTADAKLELSGWSQPEALSVNVTAVEVNGTNAIPHYTQFFEAQNSGPSNILSGRFRIFFQTHTAEGYAINELTAQPAVEKGQATCAPVSVKTRSLENGINIDCEMGKIASKASVVIRLQARLSPEALLKQPNIDVFNLTSKLTGTITSLPLDQDVSGIPTAENQVILKVAKIKKEPVALQAIPIWIPIVASLAAIIIIAIVTAVLHHFGFFKRNRPMEMTANRETIPEAQPLQDMNQSPAN